MPESIARQTLSVVAGQIHSLRSDHLLPRQFSAAGLARCCALLEAMCLLKENHRADAVGVLARTLCETWLVSLYVLLKGDPALDEISADYADAVRVMAERAYLSAELRAKVLQHTGVRKSKRLGYEQIARALGPMLSQVEGKEVTALSLYDNMYRAESLHSTHAGLGSIKPYLRTDEKQEAWSVVENPGPQVEHEEIIASWLVTYLAKHVFEAFEVKVDPPLEIVYTRLSRLLTDRLAGAAS